MDDSITIITSSSSNEQSYEDEKSCNSAYTKAIKGALQSEVDKIN